MDLRTYLTPLAAEKRDALASKCGATRGHLQNVMYGLRSCAPDLAVSLERETEGEVRRWDLRPDDWHRIWPELIGADGAPALPAEKAAA